MFGYVLANYNELSEIQRARYSAVYCGICRGIREQTSQVARLALSYDMAFLALLHMSLYEPEETSGPNACLLHPIKKRPWVDNEYIRYAADMNVALAYYNCLDDWEDDKKLSAKAAAAALEPVFPALPRPTPGSVPPFPPVLKNSGVWSICAAPIPTSLPIASAGSCPN